MDAVRRPQLLQLKLGALARDNFGVDDGEPGPFKDGATLRAGRRGFVLIETEQSSALGGALAWALKHGVDELHVLTEVAAAALARRAALFAVPATISVWVVDGRTIAPAHPAAPVAGPPAVDESWVPRLRAAGTEPVVEVEGLRAEVRGLAVARVRDDGRLDVGVSVNDREAHEELHGGQPPVEAVADVARTVAARRASEADDHPWRRMDTDRWLRSAIVRRPDLAGLDGVVLAPWWWPASARAADGSALVVCGSGLDLDLVPAAADARLAAGGDALLVVAVPADADHPVLHRLASSLRDPCDVAVVADPAWRAAAG